MTETGSKSFGAACPSCGVAMKVGEKQVGSRVTCGECLEEFVVAKPKTSTQPRVVSEVSQTTPSKPAQPLATTSPPKNPWDEDRLQLDALLEGSEMPVKRSTPGDDGEPYDFSLACKLCRTRLDFKSEQIGQEANCPDCHSRFRVPEPPKSARRLRPTKSNHDEYSVPPLSSDEFASGMDLMAAAEAEAKAVVKSAPSRPAPTPDDVARDTMRRAEEEAEEHVERKLPPRPLVDGLFAPFRDLGFCGIVFFLAVPCQLLSAAIEVAITSAEGSGTQQIISVMARLFVFLVGPIVAAFMATIFLNVIQETAHGEDELTAWPTANIFEWFTESWPLLVMAFVVVVPGALAAQMLYSNEFDGMTTASVAVGITAILLWTVFPVVLLSFLEGNVPLSRAITRGIVVASRYWIGFSLRASLLIGVGVVLLMVRMWTENMMIHFGLCICLMFVVLVYFRLLGRLTWATQDVLTEADRQAAEADE